MNCKPYYGATIQHISQPFGVNPTSYQPNGHTGVDMSPIMGYGKNLVAPEDVRIKRVINIDTFDFIKYPTQLSNGFGVLMTSLADPTIDYLYWHCLPAIPVKEGDIIKQGDSVAQMGNSGFVFQAGKLVAIEHRSNPGYPGTHLHYEKRVNNVYVDPIESIDWNIPVPYPPASFGLAVLKKLLNIIS